MTAPSPLPALDDCLVCHLERLLPTRGCDNSLRLTQQWCRQQLLPAQWVPQWLKRRGGYCDCEVLMNAFEDGTTSMRGLQLRCEAALEDASDPWGYWDDEDD